MNDQTLAKISLAGFFAFLALSIFAYENNETKISDINGSLTGRFVCVKGNFSIEKRFKSCILGKLSDKTGEISVFSCNNTKPYFKLKNKKKQDNIKICGKIKKYNGKLEIIPLKIYYS